MESSEDILLRALETFYDDNPLHGATLCRVLGPDSTLSLRVIDWFITNYAKQKRTIYILPTGQCFSVFVGYKNTLKSYGKKLFDIFRRQQHILFRVKACGVTLDTTIAQLNFFRWMIKYDVINYCEKHVHEIEKHMNEELENAAKHRKNNHSIGKTPRRRHGPAFGDCTTTNIPVRVVFE